MDLKNNDGACGRSKEKDVRILELYKKFFNREELEPIITEYAVLFKSTSMESETESYQNMKVADLGVGISIIHVMGFQFVNHDLLKKALINPDSYRGIIFTSPRAVQAIDLVLENVEDREKYLNEWKQKENYAVGDKTGCSAKDYLGIETRGTDSGNSDNLVKAIITSNQKGSKKCSNISFLFPCSQIRKSTLIHGLNEAGIHIEDIVCYTPVPKSFSEDWSNLHSVITELRQLQGNGKNKPDILVFFSPSAVKFVQDELKLLGNELLKYHVVSLGPSTAAALAAIGTNAYICSEPSPNGLEEILKCIILMIRIAKSSEDSTAE